MKRLKSRFRQKCNFGPAVMSKERTIERLGESGATHDSQSASRSGVEAWVPRNLNGWDDSDAGLSQA